MLIETGINCGGIFEMIKMFCAVLVGGKIFFEIRK